MDEFSEQKMGLAAELPMENGSERSKLVVQEHTTLLSSAYPHLSTESSPSSDCLKDNSTQTSLQYQNVSRRSTSPQNTDEDGTLARHAAPPLPSSSYTYRTVPEPRDVPLPAEDLSDDEKGERGAIIPLTHRNLVRVEESVSSIFGADCAPPFAKASRSPSVSSHSSSPPSAPDPWQSANVPPAPLITHSILDLDQSDAAQSSPKTSSSADPSSRPRTTSEERIHIRVDEMVRLELQRIQLQGLEEAANEGILSKNTTPGSAITHGPPPFASASSIRSSLSASNPAKMISDSTSSFESIVLAESQTWEKVEGLKDEWQELRNPREEVLAMSESESDIDDDEEEMWKYARAVDELSEDKGFLPSVERRRRHHEYVGNTGNVTPRAQRTPKTSFAVSNVATQERNRSHSPQPKNFFQHRPHLAPAVSVRQSKLTPSQEKLVAELRRNRSGRGVHSHNSGHSYHTMHTVSPIIGDW